ncbi:MAG TPA: monofunctional biosynthetic peptidoglycan transglycosylase [Blastocatellia bacterium]|jgi:monofunctional biosynthetic peptidoglycan transglycosylase|nr:monofunctional biosynthetic peptidoglycan transglycosylase [Blastocatellia bacterium]
MVKAAKVATNVYRARPAGWRRWAKIIISGILIGAVIYHAYILSFVVRYRSANPGVSAMMQQRESEAEDSGQPVKREQVSVPYSRISPNLVRAVLAGEDSRFFDHSGFDWEEIRKAAEKDWEEKRFHRGASTVSQQLAKNLFLSTSKNPLRKLHEALITWEMERILSKRRILELYLNVIEWGDGIYGAEAAANHYFNTSAASLSADQAAFLSAIIPNPRGAYNPNKHRRRVERRKSLILRLMRHVVIPRDLI